GCRQLRHESILSARRPWDEAAGTPEPAESTNDTAAISTNPSGQIVSTVACTRVRIAYRKVASISTATSPAVTARLTSGGPQLMTGLPTSGRRTRLRTPGTRAAHRGRSPPAGRAAEMG